MDSLSKELKKLSECKENFATSRISTFKVGGPARFFCSVETKEKLFNLLKFLDESGLRWLMVGGSSNTLFSDRGFDGVVVRFISKIINFEENKNGKIKCVADSGAITAEIARKSVEFGATGFEWGVGVPGTIGGAVVGNAGAGEGEIKDIVKTVKIWHNGEIEDVPKALCDFGYRNSKFKKEKSIIISIEFEFEKTKSKQESVAKMLQMLQYRTKTQPKKASCGCIFKNPTIDGKRVSAGKLIDESGCKSMKVGGAEVSAIHGNFIVNNGDATASDIINLIEKVKETVYEKFGVELEEEIRIIK